MHPLSNSRAARAQGFLYGNLAKLRKGRTLPYNGRVFWMHGTGIFYRWNTESGTCVPHKFGNLENGIIVQEGNHGK